MNQPNQTLYHLLALVTVGIWGMTFISTRVLLNHGFNPQEIFLLRFVMAYVGIWFFSPRKLWCDNWKDEALALVLGITGGSLYFVTENTAIHLTLVTNVAFIVCTAPLLTTLLAWAVRRYRRGGSLADGEEGSSRRLLVGSLMALVGVALVVFNGSVLLHIHPLGDLLSFSAALCWAIYSVILQEIGHRYNMIFLTRKIFFYGLLTILPFFLVNPWSVSWQQFSPPAVWFNLLFLGVFASLLCFYVWNVVLRRLGAVSSSNYLYLNPLFTFVGSMLFLDEPVSLMALLGVALVLCGIYLSERRKG
jgi:drug/metabolite transporter (DMT)-like permease